MHLQRLLVRSAPLAVLGVLACGAPAPIDDVGQSEEALTSRNNVKALGTISYAPNSFVIGNAFAGWTDELHGKAVWGQGPGNESGARYQCGYLYGESFDHCGWLGGGDAPGKEDDEACGPDCPGGSATAAVFEPVYTNGNICPQVNKTPGFCSTFMNWLAPRCTDRSAYGNVDPWKDKATPANRIEEVPHRTYLQWRYVSHDGAWVMVMDPSKDGRTEPNWYFVSSRCVDVVYTPNPKEPPSLP